MIKEKFVSFEVAELLKKVGFKEPCTSYYSNIAGIEPSISKHNKLDNYNDNGSTRFILVKSFHLPHQKQKTWGHVV